MSEKNRSFNIENKKFVDIQEKIEQVLKKKFLYSTITARLGNSLIRINYSDKNVEIESQKDNRITLLQEQDKKVYVQIMGVLDDAKVGQLWEELENFFSIDSINIIEDSINDPEERLDESTEFIDKSEESIDRAEESIDRAEESINISEESIGRSDESIEVIEKLPSKNELVDEIKKLLEIKGYFLEVEEIETFISNFIVKYNRLPVPSELKAIIKGYILMIQEEKKLKSQITEPIIEEYQDEVPSEEILQELIPYDNSTKELSSTEKLDQEERSKVKFSINHFDEVILSKEEIAGRRMCPNCGNKGLIREVDDKTKILMHSPRIYSKKKICGQCGYEWHGE